MYIYLSNKYSEIGDNDELYFCGYLQIDDEKPMKVHKVRCFKIDGGIIR